MVAEVLCAVIVAAVNSVCLVRQQLQRQPIEPMMMDDVIDAMDFLWSNYPKVAIDLAKVICAKMAERRIECSGLFG